MPRAITKAYVPTKLTHEAQYIIKGVGEKDLKARLWATFWRHISCVRLGAQDSPIAHLLDPKLVHFPTFPLSIAPVPTL